MSQPRFRGLQVIGFGHPRSALRRELVDLVLAGTKTATAGLLVEPEADPRHVAATASSTAWPEPSPRVSVRWSWS